MSKKEFLIHNVPAKHIYREAETRKRVPSKLDQLCLCGEALVFMTSTFKGMTGHTGTALLMFTVGSGLMALPTLNFYWHVMGCPTVEEIRRNGIQFYIQRFRIWKTVNAFMTDDLLDNAEYKRHNTNTRTGEVILPLIAVSGEGRDIEISVENRGLGNVIEQSHFLSDLAGALGNHISPYLVGLGYGGNDYHIRLRDLSVDTRKYVNAAGVPVGNSKVIELTNEITWDPQDMPHMLVSGSTNSGKSMFLKYLSIAADKKGWDVFIADPKHSSLGYLPKLAGVTDIDGILNMLEARVSEMRDRENKIRHSRPVPYTLIIIDEVAALQAAMTNSQKKQYQALVQQLVLMGRSSQTFVVLATQQANAQVIPTDIREQLGLKILLGETNASERQFLFGEVSKSIESLPMGKGQGLISINHEIEFFETPYFKIEPEELL